MTCVPGDQFWILSVALPFSKLTHPRSLVPSLNHTVPCGEPSLELTSASTCQGAADVVLSCTLDGALVTSTSTLANAWSYTCGSPRSSYIAKKWCSPGLNVPRPNSTLPSCVWSTE